MESKINYSLLTENIIKKACQDGNRPSLLLHSCCAPCSSSVIEYLNNYFNITVFYYNPNITDEKEYTVRKKEQIEFIEKMHPMHPVSFIEGDYQPNEFYHIAKGLENCQEGGARCYACYQKRLEETARMATKADFDYFTTTLTVSPLKKAEKINEIGKALEEKYKAAYLYSDFKKKNGYQRSIEISNQYGLYRQNYCGCEFSKKHL